MNAALKTQVEQAQTLYREGKFVEAEQVFREVLEHDPGDTGALMRLGDLALWNNQTAQAEQYYSEAGRRASWLGGKWPLNTQLNTSLAMTHYRADQFPQAAEYFYKAAGPVAVGPLSGLRALGDHMALFKDEPPYRIEGAETTRIPFTRTDPLPVLQVSVNGSEPIYVFIDTGGGEVILDTQFAASVGAQYAGKRAGSGGGTQGTIGMGRVERFTLGDLTVHNLPVNIMNTQPFAAVFDGLPVKGVIGTRFLMHFLSSIDYRNACLTLRPKSAPVDTARAKTIPFWLIQTHYMVVAGTVNSSAPMLFFLDTGLAGKGFIPSDETVKQVGIPVDWSKAEKGVVAFGETETASVTIDRVTLGRGENEVVGINLPGEVFKKPLEVFGYRMGFFIGGLVSHQFFRRYTLTLDFVDMRLILQE